MSVSADEQTPKDVSARSDMQSLAARPHLSLPSHPLLLLSDSALPLGSFAFSSGLESYLAHNSPAQSARTSAFSHFLVLTITSLATTTLPYLLAAYNAPSQLQELDNTLDACTVCPVARRASIAQGRALLTLWERALRTDAGEDTPAATALKDFSVVLRRAAPNFEDGIEISGHFAPIWATVSSAMGISIHDSVYTFLFNHAKAVISAAVRASVMGPYAAQGTLASRRLRDHIEDAMALCWETDVEEAGQGVPLCDLWVGRHEVLYSRIFNS